VAAIDLRGLTKIHIGGHVAVRDIDLQAAEGELLVLVGPSGCGKSTILRMIAGLERVTSGRVIIGGEDVTDRPPQQRDVAMVFQSYALYPHRSVRGNLEFPLRVRRLPRSRIEARVREVADLLELTPLLDRRPGQLSGGQRQRVALGRAMVREPRAFLLDEPLSNLDAALRVRTRAELLTMHRRLGATMVYVTHDQDEAMTLGDRLAVLREGRLLQVAPPMEVYGRPHDAFVARFIGSPAMNLFRGRISGNGSRLEGQGWSIDLAAGTIPGDVAGEILLGVRPHDIGIVAPEGAAARGPIAIVEAHGHDLLLHLETPREADGGMTRVAAPADAAVGIGGVIGLRFDVRRLHLFSADGERRLN